MVADMEKIKVSVVIPVYNAEKYIRKCLNSLLAQSLKEMEIICVDDGSTDASSRILEEYQRKHAKISLCRQKNLHAGVARNHGLKYAKGEYVIFLDADDFFEPYMLKGMYRKAREYSADVCICGARIYHEQTGKITEAPWILNAEMAGNREAFTPKDMAGYLFNFVKPAPWNKMFRRTFIIREALLFQNTKRSNDLYFVYAAMAAAKTIALYRKKPVYYRIGMTTNLQASRKETPMDSVYALLHLQDELRKRKIYKQFEKSFINMALSTCLYNLSDKEEQELFLNTASRLGIRGHGRHYFYQEQEYNQYLEKNQQNDMADIRLSVVIPMYQKEKVIARCLDSVLEQTLQGLEVLVVDDGSSDNGYQIVQEYMEKFSRIFLFRQQNRGAGMARDTGIRHAHGKYIIFLDADDTVPYDAYQKMYDFIEKKKADVVVGNLRLNTDSADFGHTHGLEDMFISYQKKNCAGQYKIPLQTPSVCNKMIRLSLIKDAGLHFSQARLAEDLEFSIRLFRSATRIFLLNEPVYQYLTAGGPDTSLSKTTSAAVVDSGLSVMKKLSLFFDKQGLYEDEEYFIHGPVSWLWDRYQQIVPEEDKQEEFLQFQELIHCYEGRTRYQDAIIHVFKLPTEEFVRCTYSGYLERLRNQTPEELVLKKLQSTELGFRYILQCLEVRIRYKIRTGCKRFRNKGRFRR